ncbi:hypothetical protein MG290_03190 [Flavobacterium sp. CBA20B-1]|uniref:hypothetical protein n=1 Tax=unclassified Flavobacterium TaxID=196869 RepID=UPI00222523AA|nr:MULTISPECIES: hypothetical protein [unclassified Flavobacterium]WCM42698.1 hypothetical protein MG290_03190 [Flavobacterium sp. CBA20B-1]
MENNQMNSPHKRRVQDTEFVLKFIIKTLEKGTKLSLKQCKSKYSDERLFYIALQYVTTTKKALCTALNIPIEAGCRYKRTLEKEGRLIQSIDEVICPLTKYPAHLISTNPNEFERLLKPKSNQLNNLSNGSK